MGGLFGLESVVALMCVALSIRALSSRDKDRAAIASTAYVILTIVQAVPFFIVGILTFGMASSSGPSSALWREAAPLFVGVMCFMVPPVLLFVDWSRWPANICFVVSMVILINLSVHLWPVCLKVLILMGLWNGAFHARQQADVLDVIVVDDPPNEPTAYAARVRLPESDIQK